MAFHRVRREGGKVGRMKKEYMMRVPGEFRQLLYEEKSKEPDKELKEIMLDITKERRGRRRDILPPF